MEDKTEERKNKTKGILPAHHFTCKMSDHGQAACKMNAALLTTVLPSSERVSELCFQGTGAQDLLGSWQGLVRNENVRSWAQK